MTHAKAIIGAGWGDEGKGLGVDAIAASLKGDVVVVRSNGGAQAGHGVHTPDGRHHVFHHIGSGSFARARTHLSQFFVGHPMVFFPELRDLIGKSAFPRISMDPRALITTPWDMAINQSLEFLRGDGRHGSCGLGFGETIERAERGYSLTFDDLHMSDLEDRLASIHRDWILPRLQELDLAGRDLPLAGILSGDVPIIETFLKECHAFTTRVDLRRDADISVADHVVFEGAQGLMLDMDLGEMPHVTRSLTGLPNMVRIAEEAGIVDIDTIYMSRVYATRHGAGPMPHEIGTQPPEFAQVVDLTNIPNEWQGDIRYGLLDAGLLEETIRRDLARVEDSGVTCRAALGLTCIDQLKGSLEIMRDGVRIALDPDVVEEAIPDITRLPLALSSYGPTRSTTKIGARNGIERTPEPD